MANFNLSYSDPYNHSTTYTNKNDKSKTITITDVDGNSIPKAVIVTGLFDQKDSRDAVAIVAKATGYDPKKPNNNSRFFGTNSQIPDALPIASMNSDKVNEFKVSIDKPNCGRLKPGTYKIGDILTCSYGGSEKDSTATSTASKRHAHTKSQAPKAPVAEETKTETTAETKAPEQTPATDATKSATDAKTATNAPAANQTPAPAAKEEPKTAPAQQTAAAPAQKPAPQQAPPAPPVPQYYYPPQQVAQQQPGGFNFGSFLLGAMGGGILSMLFGGGGFGASMGFGFFPSMNFNFGFHNEPSLFAHTSFSHHGGWGGGFHHGWGRHC